MANKYNWRICRRCHLPFIPYLNENQTICSWTCEKLEKEEPNKIHMYVPRFEMDKTKEFEWKTKFINNIESNGLDCWYTVQKLRSMWKLYKIVPQFPADEKGVITDVEHPECYILFEGNAKAYDPSEDVWGDNNYGDFTEDGQTTFIRAFKTFDEAKRRAVLQYDVIESLCLAYLPDEDGNEIKKTFIEEEKMEETFELIEHGDFIEDDAQVDAVNTALSKVMYEEKNIGAIDGCLIEIKDILGDGWIISYFPSKENNNRVNFVFMNPELEEVRIITLG